MARLPKLSAGPLSMAVLSRTKAKSCAGIDNLLKRSSITPVHQIQVLKYSAHCYDANSSKTIHNDTVGFIEFLYSAASNPAGVLSQPETVVRDCADFNRTVSEVLVFLAMGLRNKDCIFDEDALKRLMFLSGTKTPEGIFSWVCRGPLVRLFGTTRRIRVTVEVKRIAFLKLPKYLPHSYRQRYAHQPHWFDQLIREAIEEITPHFANRFGVQAHILGLAVPISMPIADRRELRQCALDLIDATRCPVPCDVWVVPEPDWVFGRLLIPKAFMKS